MLRIYLAPESADARAGRVRAGGNKKKSFTEGWVEFENKRRAKRIASTLNNTAMGGQPGSNRAFYAHDLWNIKYLHKFKWAHLTEKMAYEKRVRRDKMVAASSAAKKESNFYLKQVEQAKAIGAMEERKRKRAGEGGAADAGARIQSLSMSPLASASPDGEIVALPPPPPTATPPSTNPTARIVSTCNELENRACQGVPAVTESVLVTRYRIQMQHGTKIWMRLRRYTDFCKLHAELSKTLHEMPLLPPKLIFNNDEDIADRFLALDTYLCQLLSNDVIRRHTKLQAFLGLEQRCGALCDRQNECDPLLSQSEGNRFIRDVDL